MKQLQGIILLFVYISVYPQQDTSLILTEIMFFPQSGNNEFIELYNSSSSETINLNGYKIKYYTASADIITDAGWGTILLPLSYAVILEGDYDFSSGIYNNIIPPEALKLKISDNAFGATGMSNTSGRPVHLLNTLSDTLDYRLYSANNLNGYSEEKIKLNHDSLDINWSNSETVNGTPGKRNSVSPLNYDLTMISLSVNPLVPVVGENIIITANIKNKGRTAAPHFNVQFFNDLNLDSVASPDELFADQVYFNLNAFDSVTAEAGLSILAAGNYNIIVNIIYEADEDTLNNRRMIAFTAYQGNELCDLIFNEIMYAPSGGMPEWVELFNRSGNTLNLRNRRISDNSSSVYITRGDIFLPADSFIVLSKDSAILNFYSVSSRLLVLPSLPSLNNSGDDLVIKDSSGIYYDSLSYLPEWGGNSGRSLERIYAEVPTNNSENWGTTEGLRRGTPGWVNSLTPKEHDLKINSFVTLTSYGITGEAVSLKAIVKNSGISVSAHYILKFYNDLNKDSAAQQGEFIESVNGIPMASNDSAVHIIVHTGYGTGTNYLIAIVETPADDDLSNNLGLTSFSCVTVNEVRNDLVINEFMYAPASPEPEWIELFNRSSKTIELKNYMVADNRDTNKICQNTLLLGPGEYAVISSDSTILTYYNFDAYLITSNFPSLNNTGDKIILLDSLGRVIDSLEYNSGWGQSGKSTEKISADHSSIDSLNWKITLSKNKATPGYINSVTPKEFDIELSSVNTIPLYPVKGDNVKICINVKNKGSQECSFNLILYTDPDLNKIPDEFIEIIPDLFLSGGDSAWYMFNFLINNLDGEQGYFISAESGSDQDTSNNYDYELVFPGYNPGTIIINEIMYSPDGGEPEWIELFNRGDQAVCIMDWEVSDVYTTPSSAIITDELFIQPEGYIVVSKDSSILNYHRVIPSEITTPNLPVLNNDRDGIILIDNRGQTMDSLIFNSAWGGTNGFSLERRSVNELSVSYINWNSSQDIEKSTPGRINNTALKQYDLAVSSILFEPRFPVKDDDVTVCALIKNFGCLNASACRINFYIMNETLSDSLMGSVFLNNIGAEDSILVCSPVSISKINYKYIIKVEVYYENDQDIYNNIYESTVEPGVALNKIVINEIMYAPAEGEPEWIEFLNTSEDSINLNNWKMEDVSSGYKSLITVSDIYIQPGEYFIITGDSSFRYYHPDVMSKIFYVSPTSFGNTADGIILYDFREGIVDSILYKSHWGGKDGYSLERISPMRLSSDPYNWTSCLGIDKSTPGYENSVLNIRDYRKNEIIINEIMPDPDIDNCEFIELYNNSNDTINIGGWRIQDEKGNFNKLYATSYLLPPNKYFVLAADSLITTKYIFDLTYMNILNTSGLGLINSGELVQLSDIRGNIIDSLRYSEKWHSKNLTVTKNVSLERINPIINSNEKANWCSSVSPEGASPGKQNSLYCVNPYTIGEITVSPNPFSPDNDGFEDHCIINYKLKSPAASLRIRIFDSHGREVRNLVNNHSSASTGSIIFDGFNDEGATLRMGIYIVVLEAADQNTYAQEKLKTVVVVARKLN